MNYIKKILLLSSLFFVISCSSSYERLDKSSFNPKDDLSKYLYEAYKKKADFEAKKMHDWNSAKLYSEKAIDAAEGEKILPQKISYWKILPQQRQELAKGYDNLLKIYNDAVSLDPFSLAKAISSLDCWSEQQEENWQTLDIRQCRNDYLEAMHTIYSSLNKDQNKIISLIKDNLNKINLQIVYFDFDEYSLSSVSKKEIKKFIDNNKEVVKDYIIVGHTDTVGIKEYNLQLSIKRAYQVKKILLEFGIKDQNIKILGKGEEELFLKTEDEIPHPANRRAEISLLN